MKYLIIILTITLTSCDFKPKGNVKTVEKAIVTKPKIEFNLIDTVLKNLNLKKEHCKMDWVALKKTPNNTEQTIIVIPEIVAENEVEHYIELNSYIVIVHTQTGKIINNYFESSKTNRWVSDSVELIGISIDTAPYNVTDDTRAFGIRARFAGRSVANPYENEIISLFIKSDNTLKKILKNYDVMNYGGERVTNCEGEFIRENKTFIITDNKAVTNYYDILVKSKITETISYEEENGGCESEIDITTKKTVLEYDGNEYKEVDKSIKKENNTTSKIKLIDTVLKNLKIKKGKCKTDLVVLKEMPNNPEETIIVIPEIVDEGDHYFELNSYILIVDTKTGKIKHKYFESSKTNQWTSDAIELREITIDTAPYSVKDNKRAFGIRVRYVGLSHANPYENETISLFIKSENELKNSLKNFVLLVDRGAWNTDCAGEFYKEEKTLFITPKKTNGFFDILVKSKITETTNFENSNGDCDYKENITTKQTILKFGGKIYNVSNHLKNTTNDDSEELYNKTNSQSNDISFYSNNDSYFIKDIDINNDSILDKVVSSKPYKGNEFLLFIHNKNTYKLALKTINFSEDGGNQIVDVKKDKNGFVIVTSFPDRGFFESHFYIAFNNNHWILTNTIYKTNSSNQEDSFIYVCDVKQDIDISNSKLLSTLKFIPDESIRDKVCSKKKK